MPVSPMDRRQFMHTSAVAGAAVAAAGTVGAAPAQAAERHCKPPRTWSFSILGTTDLHSHVFDWDYYTDAPYKDKAGNSVGVARVATLIKQQRAEKGADHVLLVDAGDIIQGTSLAYYYARVDPITGRHQGQAGPEHPMAVAMNAMRYDAAALGNHEFNYGIDTAAQVREPVPFPAPRRERARREDAPARLSAVHRQAHPGPRRAGHQGRHPRPHEPRNRPVGQGQRRREDVVPGACRAGEEVRPAHARRSAVTSSSSRITRAWTAVRRTGTSCRTSRTRSNLVAEQVPGIDAILVGHTHTEVSSVHGDEQGRPARTWSSPSRTATACA